MSQTSETTFDIVVSILSGLRTGTYHATLEAGTADANGDLDFDLVYATFLTAIATQNERTCTSSEISLAHEPSSCGRRASPPSSLSAPLVVDTPGDESGAEPSELGYVARQYRPLRLHRGDMAALITAFVGAAAWFASFRCPFCGDYFHWTLLVANPFSDECLHCGFRRWRDPHAARAFARR